MVEEVEIKPDAYYDDFAVQQRLGIRETVQERARKSGELQFVKRGTQILYRGTWLIEWLTPEGVTPK